MYGDNKRDPANNTVLTFTEEDGFEYNQEDLGPDASGDEETAKAVFKRVDPEILRYGTLDEPTGAYDFDILHPPPATLSDSLDGAWTGQLREVYGTVSAPEGTLAMVLTRRTSALRSRHVTDSSVSESSFQPPAFETGYNGASTFVFSALVILTMRL
jgi:hypothetical protein